MKSVLVRLKEHHRVARGAEKLVIEYILSHPDQVAKGSIYHLAEHTFTSPSTIVRLCKKLSFVGFKDFKSNLISEVAVIKEAKKDMKKEITQSDDIESIADLITEKNIISLENTKNLIDLKTMEACVDLILNANQLSIFGIGSSLIVAKDAQQKFMRINRRCSVFEDWHVQYLEASNMTKGDVGMIISYSGETDEMVRCTKLMKDKGTTVISITRYVTSRISKLADYNIYVSADESTFRSGAMASRISQLNIIDILFTACANKNYEASLERIRATHIRKDKP